MTTSNPPVESGYRDNSHATEVFATKYALTRGIERYTRFLAPGDEYVAAYNGTSMRFGVDVHLTYEAALEKARVMVSKKKTSLKKQMQELNEIEFKFAKPADGDRR